MPNVPKVLTSFGGSDTTTSRTLANVKSAVDPVLAFINNTFQVANDGTLSLLRRMKTFAADAIVANSSLVVNGPATIAGKTTMNSGFNSTGANVARGSLVVQKMPDGSQGSLLVQGNQSVLGNLSSSTGFKMIADLGVAYNSNAVAGTYYRTRRYTQNESAQAQYNAGTLFQSPFAGSLVGVSTYSVGSVGGNATLGIWQNVAPGADKPTGNPNITAGLYATQFYGTPLAFPKGQYPVAVGDYFQTAVSFNTAGNQFMFVSLWFEWAA